MKENYRKDRSKSEGDRNEDTQTAWPVTNMHSYLIPCKRAPPATPALPGSATPAAPHRLWLQGRAATLRAPASLSTVKKRRTLRRKMHSKRFHGASSSSRGLVLAQALFEALPGNARAQPTGAGCSCPGRLPEKNKRTTGWPPEGAMTMSKQDRNARKRKALAQVYEHKE